MLTFEMRKTKTLSMPVLVEGIEQSHLKFKFVIEHKGVEYGFSAESGGDNVKFVIPSLDTVIEGLEAGTYNATLQVSALTEGDRGFFMQPWGEQIRVKQSVMVAMEEPVQEEEPVAEEVEKKVKLKITSIFTESDDDAEPVEVETKPRKNSKMREKLQ
jgi:hypothetical protein